MNVQHWEYGPHKGQVFRPHPIYDELMAAREAETRDEGERDSE